MSNGHASANCVEVTASNAILFPLTNPLHYVNPIFLKTVSLLKGMVLFFANTAVVLGGDGCGLSLMAVVAVDNGSCTRMGATAIYVPLKQPFPLGHISTLT